MTAHLHDHYVDGCYRCELRRDEAEAILAEIEAEAQQAWVEYRDAAVAAGKQNGQMRRSEFIAGYIAGALS